MGITHTKSSNAFRATTNPSNSSVSDSLNPFHPHLYSCPLLPTSMIPTLYQLLLDDILKPMKKKLRQNSIQFESDLVQFECYKSFQIDAVQLDQIRDELGHTLLHLAVIHHKINWVKLLLSSGCHPRSANHQLRSPLHTAIITGDAQSTSILLAHSGLNLVVATDLEGNLPIHLAVKYYDHNKHGHDILEQVIAYCSKEEMDHLNLHDQSVLSIAIESNGCYLLKRLLWNESLLRPLNINIAAASGMTPLHLAVKMGFSKLCCLLLEAGADPNVTNCRGQTPLHLAFESPNCQSIMSALFHYDYVWKKCPFKMKDELLSVSQIMASSKWIRSDAKDCECSECFKCSNYSKCSSMMLETSNYRHWLFVESRDVFGCFPLHYAIGSVKKYATEGLTRDLTQVQSGSNETNEWIKLMEGKDPMYWVELGEQRVQGMEPIIESVESKVTIESTGSIESIESIEPDLPSQSHFSPLHLIDRLLLLEYLHFLSIPDSPSHQCYHCYSFLSPNQKGQSCFDLALEKQDFELVSLFKKYLYLPIHSTSIHSTPIHSTPTHSTPTHSTHTHSTPTHSTHTQLNIQLASDLHLETLSSFSPHPTPQQQDLLSHQLIHSPFTSLSTQPKYIALLGDICPVNHPIFKRFLLYISTQFDTVFLILGNHEYYGSSLEETNEKVSEICQLVNNIIWLKPGTSYLINHIRIIGCTLWSSITDQERYSVSNSMNDYRFIQVRMEQVGVEFKVDRIGSDEQEANKTNPIESTTKRNLTVDDTLALFQSEWQYLNNSIHEAEKNGEYLIIMTHYSPLLRLGSSHPQHYQSDVNSAFSTNLVQHMNSHVLGWFYGHTHWYQDLLIDGRTRVVANQAGYIAQNLPLHLQSYNPSLVIPIPVPGSRASACPSEPSGGIQ